MARVCLRCDRCFPEERSRLGMQVNRTTPQQVATDVVNWLNGLPPGRLTLPPPRAPESFEIAVNRQVARALGILLPSDEELLRLMKKGDKS